MSVVYPKVTGGVSWSQGDSFLKKGEAWDADAPLVRERPDLFEETPGKVVGAPKVERATRAPGEVRGPRPGPGARR